MEPAQPKKSETSMHNRQAPYWAAALVVLIGIGLSSVWIDGGTFWKGYVLDITGPAWAYILFRGRFTARADNFWTRFFTPLRTMLIIVAVLYGIEIAQFLRLYESTFDLMDFFAYISVLFPLFILDLATYEES
jgi:hypothetical protein